MIPRHANLRRWQFGHEIASRGVLPPSGPLREVTGIDKNIRPGRNDVRNNRFSNGRLIPAEVNVGDVGEDFQRCNVSGLFQLLPQIAHKLTEILNCDWNNDRPRGE